MALRIDDLSIDYDNADDVLYISIGRPREAATFEERDGLLVRKDPTTGVPIAVTVMQYETHFRKLEDVSWIAEQHLPLDRSFPELPPIDRIALETALSRVTVSR